MQSTRLHLFLLGAIAFGATATAQNGGAIYTSTRNGTTVNGNVYNQKRDVYLVGGPTANSNCGSAGLADGRYYFQVTDPSGQVLLSSDPINDRQVQVSNGVITAYVDDPSTSNRHATNPGPCGSRVVQLIPFLDTPNSGGEYKVWLTPTTAYDWSGAGFFGFQANRSKTDNFKVRTGGGQTPSQSTITGFKFFDASENGLWEPSNPLEVPIPGWRIEIYLNGTLQDFTYTDIDGRYVFLRPVSTTTTYTIVEQAPGGFIGDNIPGAVWLAMTPRQGTVVPATASVAGPTFGNLSFEVKPGVGRTKGFWQNENGRALLAQCDPEWRESLYLRKNIPVCLRTNISSLDPWQSLLIPPQPLPGTLPPFQAPFFALPFVDAHNYFANWIVGNPALGHAGFILSTQVAASILNNSCGFMQFTTYVDRFQNGVLVSFDSMVRDATGLLCAEGAGMTGPNDPAQFAALREMMLNCTNEFGTINNTGDLGEVQVVYGPTRAPKGFTSPY